jgi:cytochrome o ubiquinol oxidase subunit I
MLGKLSWDAIPFNEPLPLISMAVVLIVILAVLALITVKGWWPYLWRDWLTASTTSALGLCT